MNATPLPSIDSLQDGLALIAAAPPQVHTEMPRAARLHLQARLLSNLPERRAKSPFRICWRSVFSWGSAARVACGEVCWEVEDGVRHASFAVDERRCTLAASGAEEVTMLALHLSEATSAASFDAGCSPAAPATPASPASRSAQARM